MGADEVAAQWWAQPKARPQNVAQLAPAPRELEPRMIECAKRSVNSLAAFWLILTLFFGVSHAFVFTMMPSFATLPVLPLLLLALTIWSFRWRAAERGKLLLTMREGDLVSAQIRTLRTVEHRGKYGRVIYVTYYVGFAIGDRVVELVSRDPGLSLLQVGLSEEVLYTSSNPDTVVPTFLLA